MKVWHYTTDSKLDSIYTDGELRPTSNGIPNGEQPALWFSSNQIWEPTANKAFATASGIPIRPLTSTEMKEMFQLVRFGIDSELVMPWNTLKKTAHISRSEQGRLIKRGKLVGSSPTQWFGSLDPISLDLLIRQDFVSGKWQGEPL